MSLTSVANLNDSEIRIQDLTGGISIDCGAQLDPVSFTGPSGQKPVCYLTLDVPEQATLTDPATGATRTALVGRRPVVLNAGVSHSGNRITWVPTKDALDYIDFTFGRTANLGVDRLLAHLTLKGRFIWGTGTQRRHLGGMEMGVPGTETPTQTTLPLDGQGGEEGSDFELWFWIESPRTTGFSGGTATTGTVVGGRTGGTIVPGAGGTELKGAPSAPPATTKSPPDAGAGPETVTLAALELPQALRAGEQGQGTLRLSGPAPRGGVRREAREPRHHHRHHRRRRPPEAHRHREGVTADRRTG